MSYRSTQPVREWVAILVVIVTIASFSLWAAWRLIVGLVADMKKAIDSVWRDRR